MDSISYRVGYFNKSEINQSPWPAESPHNTTRCLIAPYPCQLELILTAVDASPELSSDAMGRNEAIYVEERVGRRSLLPICCRGGRST